MRQNQALFANFICKFGDRNLADFLKEIVVPAFTDDVLVRKAHSSEFHLLDVRLLNLKPDGSEPAVAGRFVRDTVLRRSQYFDPQQGLVQNDAALESSPSAFFVLLLVDHRIIYFAETRHAPDVSSFEATMIRFLSRKYHAYIDAQYAAAKERNEKVSKKNLREELPHPTLDIVPITNRDDVEAFVRRYAVLQRLDVVIHRRNDEIDASALMESIGAYNERLHGERTRVTTSDSAGLDKEGAIETIKEIGPGGNQSVKLKGQDQEGNPLSGDNEDFSVRANILHLPQETPDRAAALYFKMTELTEAGTLSRPRIAERIRQRIVALTVGLI